MEKPFIDNLSIQPTFLCNFNCNYCYLGNLRNYENILNLRVLEQRIEEILNKYQIRNINLYGGEISLLKPSYLEELVAICFRIGIKPTVITNLSNDWIIDFCEERSLPLSISLNEERPYYKETLEKIKKLRNRGNKNLSVVVLPSMLDKDYSGLMGFYEKLGLDVFFIQYHPSVHSCKSGVVYDININHFSSFLKGIISEKHRKDYEIKIINEDTLNNKDYNPLMSGFLFITPFGQYSTVLYQNGIERYEYFNSLEEWEECCKKEYKEYFLKCNLCEYFGKCKAEHLEVMDKKECSGLYELQKWYEEKKWN